MKLITRTQLGWPATAAPTQATAKGVKIHYEGSPVSTRLLTDHAACIAEWKAIRRSHLANKVENYSDIAYNYGGCPHGYLLEGRGIGRRTGANGNQTLNKAHYAICGLVGSEGLTEPTDGMLTAIRDGIDLLRAHGAESEILGHRDGYATACPGTRLYTWVQKGAPRPGAAVVSLGAVVYGATHSAADERRHPGYADDVEHVQDALVARKRLRAGAFERGIFDVPTKEAYSAEQKAQGFTGSISRPGSAADGVPGRSSLTTLGAGRFTVVA